MHSGIKECPSHTLVNANMNIGVDVENDGCIERRKGTWWTQVGRTPPRRSCGEQLCREQMIHAS